MRIAETTGISFDVNAVLRRTNCIGKDAMQLGDGTQEKDGGEPMIEIYDTDIPIIVADKIITGTKPYVAMPLTRAIAKAITGSETAAESIDMFDIDEIKEIADYLMVYYESHKEGEANE